MIAFFLRVSFRIIGVGVTSFSLFFLVTFAIKFSFLLSFSGSNSRTHSNELFLGFFESISKFFFVFTGNKLTENRLLCRFEGFLRRFGFGLLMNEGEFMIFELSSMLNSGDC